VNSSLPSIAIRHPIMVLMLTVTVVGVGIIAWFRLPLKFLPDMDFPFVGCFIPYSGATPAQVEKEIAVPAEGEFRTIPNLRRIMTQSSSEGCEIDMMFESGTAMGMASAEVRDRIERLKLVLPEEADRVYVYRHSVNAIPVMALGLFRVGDEAEFVHLVRTVVEPRLSRLDGVAEVKVFASKPDPEVLIEFDQNLLRSHNASLYQIIATLQTSNLNISIGELTDADTKFYVRVTDEFSRPEQLADLVVGANGLRLKEVASVGFRTREEEGRYDIDGKGGAFIIVRKESEANTVDTCRVVREEIERIEKDPIFAGTEHFYFFDQSELILAALSALIDAGKLGGLMAFAVLFFFLLRVRPTLVVALAIPISAVAALVYMFFADISLNLVTMTSMIVAVGMLVDDAVVVLENIYRYHQLGRSPYESATRGASEVGVAITASTLTTIVVFIPVLYMERGEMETYMRQFAGPMTVALLASLLVALTLIPLTLYWLLMRDFTFLHGYFVRLKHILRLPRQHTSTRGLLGRILGVHPVTRMIRAYVKTLDYAMHRRLGSITVFLAVIVITFAWPFRSVGRQEMAPLDLREVDITLKFDQNFDMAAAKERVDAVKTAVNAYRDELGIKNVFSRYTTEEGAVELYLRKPEDYGRGEKAPFTTQEVLAILGQRLPERLPGVELKMSVPEAGEKGDAAQTISVRLRGDDANVLHDYAERLKDLMAGIPNLSDITVKADRARQEVQLQVDAPKSEEAGINPSIIARTVDVALRGTRLPYLKQGGREFPVWAQFREEDRKTRANLDNVMVIGATGSLVPLNQLVEFSKAQSPLSILRVDGKNVTTVTAKFNTDDLLKVQGELKRLTASFELPLGYSIDLGDEFTELDTSAANFGKAVSLAIILVYIAMGALFESFVLPLSILTTVPLAFVGVYWVLFLTGTPLDTVGIIGCILMVGVIVKNGIVLVDHVNLLRRQGMERHEAVLQAGRDRFRPVWMTALTTILGCVPLAIGSGSGSAVSFVSLGRAFIGGLTAGTVLTLVVVPLAYTIIEDFEEWCACFFAGLKRLGSSKTLTETPPVSPSSLD